MKSIEELATQLELPEEIVESANTYKIKLFGRSINGMAATKILVSVRMHKYPLTIRELAKVADIDKKSLARSYRNAILQLDICPPIDEPLTYVESVASNLGIRDYSVISAVKNLVTKKPLSGSDPKAVAAAAFYNNLDETQGSISKAANVSTVTIRSLSKRLKE